MSLIEFAWVDVAERLPPYNQIVVCTDGERRWIDVRMTVAPELEFAGCRATHWYPVPDVGITTSLPVSVPALRDEILSIASTWKGANGGIYTIHGMALEIAQALASRFLAEPIFRRCAMIAELYGVGREKGNYDGRDIAVRIQADAADFLTGKRG